MISTHWSKPHDPPERNLRLLDVLARQAADLIERSEAALALRESERELSRANAVLRRANTDLEQFAYSASHDLQEPIRNISIYSEILARRYARALDAKGMEHLSFIAEGARRMEMLVKDLLAYAQSANLEEAPPDMANTGAALERALSNLSLAIGESKAEVTCGKLPDVRVPGLQLEHLFQNLIENAIKYRREDEPPRIQITVKRDSEHWLFSVSDNGIGIPPEYKERVFGMFKRLHGNEKYSGTGIGLAICQKVVERNGGRIWVESEGPGLGSTFHFTLPAGGA
jgi:light-regulated signal transduction histidine kinase (bacteriophytochrome)